MFLLSGHLCEHRIEPVAMEPPVSDWPGYPVGVLQALWMVVLVVFAAID